MKELQISIHFEYAEHIEALLDAHDVAHYVVIPRAEGRDREGHHDGSQVFPGTLTLIVAQVEGAAIAGIMDALRDFRDAKAAHRHLEAAVIPVEQRL